MIDQNINFEEYAKDAPTFLGKHEYGRLREAIHTSQLGVFKEVFLRSLKVMSEVLRQIPVEGQSGLNLFDQKVNDLCLAFKRLKDMPELYSNETESFRNIAVTAFVFYRVLYKGAYAAFSQHHQTKVQFDVDSYVLFKRIPYKLYDFLGGQYWRLYEFYEVVEGDLVKVKLNQDIQEFIERGCERVLTPGCKETSVESRTVNQVEASPDSISDIKTAVVDYEILNQQFLDWVRKELNKGYLCVNQRGIFSSRLRYGADLFIDEEQLIVFCSIYKKDFGNLRDALKIKDENKVYRINFKKRIIEAYRLKGFEYNGAEFNPPEIKEQGA